MPPRISIIIPCHDDGIYLAEALDSIDAACTGTAFEVIVVDDGSRDESTSAALTEARERGVTVLQRGSSGGPAAARNTGIFAAASPILLTLDVDNRIRPGFVETGIRLLEAYPAVGVVYGDAAFFGDKTGRWTMGGCSLGNELCWNRIDNCAIFRRKVWEDAGGYPEDPGLIGYEDWALWLSALEAGWEFACIPRQVFDYRVREGSTFDRSRAPEAKRLLRGLRGKLLEEALKRLAALETDLPLRRALWELVRRRFRERARRARAERLFDRYARRSGSA